MGISRAISPLVPGPLREPAKRIRSFVSYEFGTRVLGRDPLIPPDGLSPVGFSNYTKIADEFFAYFKELADLKPSDRVLDIGCGTGRMAGPLINYLESGAYDGIDVLKPAIDWCQHAFTRRHPNFRFHYADIQSELYNRRGKQEGAHYQLPFADASFDFVFLASVFTHMLPATTENYLAEIKRVMKPGARCLATFFLITSESLQLMNAGAADINFADTGAGYYVTDLAHPENAVAYPETTVRDFHERYGLKIREPIRFGDWCGRKDGLSYQDIVVSTH